MCKTDPGPIWMAWSGFDQTHLVRIQAGVQESSGPVLTECNRPATSFPLSDSVAFFLRRARINMCKSSPGPIKFCLIVSGFWPNGSGPEASHCATIIRPASGQCFPADPDRMRIGYGMFTGSLIGYSMFTGILFCVFCTEHQMLKQNFHANWFRYSRY